MCVCEKGSGVVSMEDCKMTDEEKDSGVGLDAAMGRTLRPPAGKKRASVKVTLRVDPAAVPPADARSIYDVNGTGLSGVNMFKLCSRCCRLYCGLRHMGRSP